MLATVGLTALYTLRCVWMVFYGAPAAHGTGGGERHVHDAGPAMKVALIPLAFGTLVTWLLAGPFRGLLQSTLPLHFPGAEAAAPGDTWRIAGEVLAAPATYIALAVVALGILVWLARKPFTRLIAGLEGARKAAEAGLGFESINRGISRAVQGAGEGLRVTQSGFLNWNVAGIVIAVVAVLAALVWGG
jgi:NADH-quinone oxidoreductase subunit L